jgi:hypothetical protein
MSLDVNEWKTLLESIGLSITAENIDENGIISFNMGDYRLLLILSNSDELFVRFIIPNFWSIDSDNELIRVLVAVNRASDICKATKFYINNDQNNVTASVEFLFDHSRDNPAHITRYIDMCINGANTLRSLMDYMF